MPIESRLQSPRNVEIAPNHIGLLGEIVFTAMHGPPDPVINVIYPILEQEAPEWVPIDKLNIQCSHNPSGKNWFRLYHDSENSCWEPDAFIRTSCNPRIDPIKWKEEPKPPDEWRVEFPVEIKTGSDASLSSSQSRVMKYVASKPDKYPLIVRLRINDVPERYTLTDIQVVTAE